MTDFCGHQPQKADPYQCRIVLGGDIIYYPEKL